MIMKLLLVVGVVGVIYFMFIKKKPEVKQKKQEPKKNKEKIQSNDMVECSTCNVFVEVDDMIISNNKYYCSDECLEKVK